MSNQPLVPPFTHETAEQKVKKAQALWNTQNPEKVILAYTEDSIWRNRDLFVRGHAQIKEFLVKKWQKEKQYKLRKELFAFTDNKIAVQFWYEYYDENKKAWFRCYGLEDWTFESDGRMRKRQMSGNEIEISDDQRWYKGKSSDEEYDQVEITEEHCKQSSNSDQGTEPTEYESGSDDHESGLDGYATPNEEFELEEESEDLGEEVEVKVKKALKEAEDIKSIGSEYFRTREWHEALQEYQRALSLLPPRPAEPVVRGKGKGKEKETGEEGKEALEAQPSELEQQCANARAILNGNIGACYVKLGDHKKVVEACTAALSDDPKYVKVLHRRALSNDALGTWASLTSAEQDYTSLIDMLPAHSTMLPEIRSALRNLAPRKEAAQSAEMTEMMGKLKGLGNNILGNFGLSTENFKFEPNGQGGYSVNFVR